jgi:hypothetical protein
MLRLRVFGRDTPIGEWSTILKCVYEAAEKKLHDEFEFMQELAEEAQSEFQYQSSGQRAARQFLYGGHSDLSLSEIEEYDRVSKALVEGIAHPIWELESVCFWLLKGEDLSE